MKIDGKEFWFVCLLSGILLNAFPLLAAEGKKLEQAPKDVAELSTTWAELPEEIGKAAIQDGPVSAVTKAPLVGTGKVVKKTAKTLWEDVALDEEEWKEDGREEPILKYQF